MRAVAGRSWTTTTPAAALAVTLARPDKQKSGAITRARRPDESHRRATTMVSSQRLRGSARAGMHPDGCMVETHDQMARHLQGEVRERQAGSSMGGKLRGSRAEWTWHRLHVLAPHQRSQPVACVSQVTMAWKRSGVRVP